MLQVDDREDNKIFKILAKKNVEFETKRLIIGDFVFSEKNICIEHKQLPDFIGSFRSSHLQQQLLRMQNSFKRNYVFLSGNWKNLIFNPHHSLITVNQRIGMFASLLVRYDAKFCQVDDLNQLVDLVVAIGAKTDDGKVLEIIQPQYVPSKDIYLNILCQVPLIGFEKAKSIKKQYPSLIILQQALRDGSFSMFGIGQKLTEGLNSVFIEG